MKFRSLIALGFFAVGSMASAQTMKMFSCRALDGNQPGLFGMVQDVDKTVAETKFIEALKQAHIDDVTKVECSTAPTQGTLADLTGKKWGFIGLKSYENYLVFKDNQVLFVQECGAEKEIQKFNAEVVGDRKLKLSMAGTEGSCNPHYIAGFKDGSIITLQIVIYENKPADLLINDQRPGETTGVTSLYRQF